MINEKRSIVYYWLGPQRVYLITGAKNAQEVLRSAGHFGNEELVLRVLPQLDGVTKKDVQAYKNDRSGRGQKPLDNTPEQDRIWAPSQKIITDHLSSSAATATMMEKFSELMTDVFQKRPQGEWETLSLWQFVRTELVEAAIVALAGTKLMELNPGFVEALWAYDDSIYPLLFGVPQFLYKKGYEKRDRFHEMGERWQEYAFANYDFDGPDDDWEEIFGTRFVRLHAKLLKEKGFDRRSRSGMALGAIWSYVICCYCVVHFTNATG